MQGGGEGHRAPGWRFVPTGSCGVPLSLGVPMQSPRCGHKALAPCGTGVHLIALTMQGPPGHVFVAIATFVGKAELSCLIWVMPCKPQIVHEIHGEKQFKILCLSVFCALETVKPFHVVTGG